MSTRGRSVPVAGSASSRERLLASAGALARLDDWQRITVERICDHAGVSKRTYYQLFPDRRACLETAIARAGESLRADAQPDPEDGVPLALRRLAAALRADPTRAWLAVVEPRAQRACRRVSTARSPRGRSLRSPPTASAPSVASAALTRPSSLRPTSSSPTGSAGAPRSEKRSAASELVAPPRFEHHAGVVAGEAPPRLSMLARSTLLHLDAHPGDSNCAVAAAVGIRLESQASRHLRTLEKAQLVRHTRKGRSNHWSLTDAGRALADRLR